MLKKYFLTNLPDFDLHFAGVYCKPCLQPISCLVLVYIFLQMPQRQRFSCTFCDKSYCQKGKLNFHGRKPKTPCMIRDARFS